MGLGLISFTNSDANAFVKKTPAQEFDKPDKSSIYDINNLKTDTAKIKTFNQQHPNGNYIILNKKTSTATVFTPEGKTVQSFEVGTGEEKGDNLSDGFGFSGKAHKTTPPGEYTFLKENNALIEPEYNNNIFYLGTNGNLSKKQDSQLAIHQVPTDLIKERVHKFNDGNLANNRMSFGCINLLQKSFEKLVTLVKGQGTRLYVLPEEKDNSLKLIQDKNGNPSFEQTKYHQTD